MVAGRGDVAECKRAGGATSCPPRASTCSVFLHDRLDGWQHVNNDSHIYFSSLCCCLLSCFVGACFPIKLVSKNETQGCWYEPDTLLFLYPLCFFPTSSTFHLRFLFLLLPTLDGHFVFQMFACLFICVRPLTFRGGG